jgi:hypothetical protein
MELPRRSEIITVSFCGRGFLRFCAGFDDATAAADDRRNTVAATDRVSSDQTKAKPAEYLTQWPINAEDLG